MKTLAELNELRDKMKGKMATRKEDDGTGIKLVVGMATCGIAAGARPVLMTLTEEVANSKLDNVSVSQTGCIGICQYEPIVEVFEAGKDKVTYVKVDSDKAKKIFAGHIIGGRILEEFTIGSVVQGGAK
ncbi:hypothetical protein FACS1894219_02770 [Clostridia bacterium]|nr:hypothetical protein FACS1894219_02770 [Clostridia bacterium]